MSFNSSDASPEGSSSAGEYLQAATFILGDLTAGALILGLAPFLGLGHPFNLSAFVWLILWIGWRAYQGLYPGYGKSPQTELRLHTTSTLGITLVQLASQLALTHLGVSPLHLLFIWLLILVLSLLIRYMLRGMMVRSGQFGRPVAIIGAGRSAEMLVEQLMAQPTYGLRPVAVYDDNVALHGKTISGIPVMGDINNALAYPKARQALIAIPGARAEVRQHLVNSIYQVYPMTWLVADLFDVPNQALQPHSIGSIASLEIRNNLNSRTSRFIKRFIDLFGSIVGGILILPVLVIIAIAIKLDSPGPAIYRARRLGCNGQPFDCYKFRSMHRDAEAKLAAVLASDEALAAEFAATHKLREDPRVTRIGTFLRKTSLDELPQLMNVIDGTMSLVGPRPIVQAEVEKYGAVYEIYKQVRPGMTGYWQANGRSDTSYNERVTMDKFYVTNWSPWLDIVILIQTVRVVFMGKGAY